MPLEGYVGYKKEDAEKYTQNRWWLGLTLGDLLDKGADLYPNKEALVEGDTRLSYGQLREKTNKLAINLIKLGIKSGDRVFLQFPNWIEFVYAFFALHKIGAITVLLLPGHGAAEITHLCRLTKTTAWMVPEKYRNTDYLPIINEVRRSNPQLEHIILIRAEESKQFINFEKLMQDIVFGENEMKELAMRKPEPIEVAVICPSGGTTGLPKAAPRTHNDYICGIEYKARGLELNSFDVMLVMTPLGHQMSLNAGLLASIFTFGKTVLQDSNRPEDFCKTVQKEKVTCAPIVPTLIGRILDFEGLKDYGLSSLIRLNVGGAASPPALVKRAMKEIGCKYCNAFGSVEGIACQVRLDDEYETFLSGAARPLTPYDTIKVISPADGKELPPDTEGELVGKGPTIFTGYLNLPEENKRVFTPDGFYRTGDLAKINSKGYVEITGRIKDIIIRGGENISAKAVEELISAHPDVKEVAVVGMPDTDLGERTCSYIVPHPGKKPTLEEISKFLKEKGAGKLLIPDRLEYIDAIPLTSANKPDKRFLREAIKKRAGITS